LRGSRRFHYRAAGTGTRTRRPDAQPSDASAPNWGWGEGQEKQALDEVGCYLFGHCSNWRNHCHREFVKINRWPLLPKREEIRFSQASGAVSLVTFRAPSFSFKNKMALMSSFAIRSIAIISSIVFSSSTCSSRNH
jgi:hypothetical protein